MTDRKTPLPNHQHIVYHRRKRFLHWLAITYAKADPKYMVTTRGITID